MGPSSSKGEVFQFNGIDLAILAFYIWVVITSLKGINALTSANAMVSYLRGLLFYFYFRANFFKEIRINRLVNVMTWLVLLESTIALIQVMTQSRFGSLNDYFGETIHYEYANTHIRILHTYILRSVGTFHNPNVLADWLVFMLPVISIRCILKNSNKMELKYVLALILGAAALISSFSRSGWASIMIAFGVIWLFKLRYPVPNILKSPHRIGIIGLALLLVSLIIILMGDDLIKLIEIVRYRILDLNLKFRSNYIAMSKSIIMQFPIFGVGVGNFSNAAIYVDSLSVTKTFAAREQISGVHNIFLLAAVETGIIGCVTLCVLFFQVIRGYWKSISFLKYRSPIEGLFLIGFLGSFIGALVNANFELTFWHVSVTPWVFILAAISSSYLNHTMNMK